VGDVDRTFTQHVTGSGSLETNDPLSIKATVEDVRMDIDTFNKRFDSEVSFDFKHPKDTRVVPNIDAKLGLGYTYQYCNCTRSTLTVEAGYQSSHYFKAVDRFAPVDIFNKSILNQANSVDMSFEGPYLSVQVTL
jgi:hypothetical protein